MLDVRKEISKLVSIETLDTSDHDIKPDILKEVVGLYNKAILSLQSKSDDIAIIELKKAISLYSSFTEAKVLLSLCYIVRDEMDEAEKILKGIIQKDRNIETAHLYLQHIKRVKKKQKIKQISTKSNVEKKSINNNISKTNVIKIGAAFLVGVIVSYIFSTGFYKTEIDNIKNESKNLQLKNEAYEKENANYRLVFSKSDQEINSLTEELDITKTENEYLKNVIQLFEIEDIYNNGDREKAAERLFNLKDINYKDDALKKYMYLNENILLNVANRYYNMGKSLFLNQGSYNEAHEILLKSLEYYENGKYNKRVDYSGCLYYVARCYQCKGDNSNAIKYFNKVLNDFPNSYYVGYANNKLKQIKSN